MNGFMKKLRAPLLVAACVAALTVTAAAPAHAAGGDWLHVSGGQGKASWTWSSSNPANLDGITLVAWDQKCDNIGVYTYMRIVNELGYGKDTRKHTDPCSGGESGVGGLIWRDNARVRGVTVYVCADVTGTDICGWSYYDNPYSS
ncbi:hypothetical protein GCM10022252_19140 [Streptosporangium oxazolinicum]|uniref:Secreted protein n=2 Tax=Streptosporangium oxazolinicum TaxID=909287 RepID=A0ABP8ANZ1_9ACTN